MSGVLLLSILIIVFVFLFTTTVIHLIGFRFGEDMDKTLGG